MRKTAFIMALLLCALGLRAQDYQMNLHRSGEVIFENGVNTIVDIRFEGSQPANMLINLESGTTTFPITRFDSITFSMPTEYTITVDANNNAWGTVSGGGVYYAGTTCNLSATPASGYQFDSWKKNGVVVSLSPDYSFTVTESATYTAYFAETPAVYYTVTTNVSPTGAGTVTGGGIYPEGTTVTLTATANSGYTFSQWQDGSTTNPRTITVTQNATYTAFFAQEQPPAGDTVFIVYNGSSVAVTNPFESTGVTVETSNANVTVNSTRNNVPYVVSGSSSNGSLTIYSSSAFYLALSSLNLTSSSTAAINLASNVSVTLALRGTSSLTDNANSPLNGALVAAGDLTVGGATLNVTGNGKHGIAVEGTMTVNSGTINILSTDSDGIHGSSALVWNGGTLNITAPGSDGLDFSGAVTINAGSLTINTTTLSQRSIKVSGIFTMTGGSLTNKNGDIFFVNNTVTTITLTDVNITNEDADGVFLRAAAAGWGSEGSNGGKVNLIASGQIIDGDILVDEVSALNLYLAECSDLAGSINPDGQEGDVYVEISGGSVWTLTGDSYITSLTCDADSINLNGYTLYVNGVAYEEGSTSEGEAIDLTVSSGNGGSDGHGPGGDRPDANGHGGPGGSTPPAKPEG